MHESQGEAEEVLDVVDQEGEVVGQATRSQVHEEQLPHLAVHVLLVDVDGRVWLQRRAPGKRTFPGLWTSSASGHVPAGARPEQAARREVAEEMGLVVPSLEPVGTVRWQEATVGEDELVHVFTGQAAEQPDPDSQEVSEVSAMSPRRVDAWLEAEPEVFAGSFPPVWELARAHLSPHGR